LAQSYFHPESFGLKKLLVSLELHSKICVAVEHQQCVVIIITVIVSTVIVSTVIVIMEITLLNQSSLDSRQIFTEIFSLRFQFFIDHLTDMFGYGLPRNDPFKPGIAIPVN